MKLKLLLNQPGVRLGALIDGAAFALMLVVWYAHGWWTSSPARTAESGAMDLLWVVVLPVTMLFALALTLGSSLLGAIAGYSAAHWRSPWVGALLGLSNAMLAAAVLTLPLALKDSDAGLLSLWINKLQWLAPPAMLAGAVVGVLARKRVN